MSKDPSDQIIDDREAGRSSGIGDNPWNKLAGEFGGEDSAELWRRLRYAFYS